MSRLNTPLVRIAVRYGAIAGILALAFVIAAYYAGTSPFFIPPYLDLRVLLIALLGFMTLKEVRDYHYNGILYFWQGLIACFILVTTLAVVSGCGIQLFGRWEEQFIPQYVQQATERINGLPPEAVQELGQTAIDEARRSLASLTVDRMAFKYASQTYILGLFISIIISVILRKQPNPS
ncbi:MAG: DUF4199 domain-containing protein [Cyclobacteriaceae bacterium]|nr:DUF4199 domain-containing protein [Cyclobacteriaceae bacterium]